MNTIQASVNPRLLTKANRLFTGTLDGRVIEILQNARRAGATNVEITNQDGYVTVQDNGQGIDDFARLLDLGGSGWNESLEESEDPAGVGLFCLMPRQVTVRSLGRIAVIPGEGWTGTPVTVMSDPDPVGGTTLEFQDELWSHDVVEPLAVFSGMNVMVDHAPCANLPFIGETARLYPELGCRIEVREPDALNPWHRGCQRGYPYANNAFINFHGQVVGFAWHPVGEPHLFFLIDMTDEPTGIRLMLPARTRLVENETFEKLKAAMELEAYRYVHHRGHHRLSYKEYVRARELDIVLPEAMPTFRVGLLTGDTPEPIEVTMPEHFPLSDCYRLNPSADLGDETDEANVHLLAALGTFASPFVPVDIRSEYDGYSWAKLPTIDKVEFKAGKVLQESWLGSGMIVCVEQLEITAHTSDGRVFTSPVCMGIPPVGESEENHYREETVYVTPEAQDHLNAEHIWHHLGGWSDDGDTYDTQQFAFADALDDFWARLVGPYEQLRLKLLDTLSSLQKWKQITLSANGRMEMVLKNGSRETIPPPTSKKAAHL